MDKQAARKGQKERNRKNKRTNMRKIGYTSPSTHQRRAMIKDREEAERKAAMDAFLGNSGYIN